MAMQWCPASPPTTPRPTKQMPETPSTCAGTPLFEPMSVPRRRKSSSMDEFSLSPGFKSPSMFAPNGFPSPPACWQRKKAPAQVPEVLDSVSVSLLSLLPPMDQERHIQSGMNPYWNIQKPIPMPGRGRALSPATPRRATGGHCDVSRSPPPAPNQRKVRLGEALDNNDMMEVVEILAKHPHLATTPFLDGNYELPLVRATRLRCDEAIIELLKDNGAELDNGENIMPMNNIQIPQGFPMW